MTCAESHTFLRRGEDFFALDVKIAPVLGETFLGVAERIRRSVGGNGGSSCFVDVVFRIPRCLLCPAHRFFGDARISWAFAGILRVAF